MFIPVMPPKCLCTPLRDCPPCRAIAENERERARGAGQKVAELLKTQGGRDKLRSLIEEAERDPVEHAINELVLAARSGPLIGRFAITNVDDKIAALKKAIADNYTRKEVAPLGDGSSL